LVFLGRMAGVEERSKAMRKVLEEEKFEIWEKELPIQFVPDQEELKSAIQFGKEFARKMLRP